MDSKRICVIFIFGLFLILNASCICAHDNSTDPVYQNSDNDFISGDGNDFSGVHSDFGQWGLDENGNIVITPSNENYAFENISTDSGEDNCTDLRNKNDDFDNNQTQNASSMLSPSQMNTLWAEYVKDPQAFMEKYNSLPNASSVIWDDNVSDNSCNNLNSKEFDEFMDFVKKTSIKPDAIESKDVNVFYSKDNVYKVRILNPVGDSVGSGINVTFVFNGKKIKVKTDDNGYASFRFDSPAGNYFVKTCAGNLTSKNKIIVKPLFKTKNVTKKYKKSSKFTVKLVKPKGKSVSKQNIKITFKGKTYNVKTDSKGLATFNIPKNLKTGKYTIKTYYNGCAVKNTVTVKK